LHKLNCKQLLKCWERQYYSHTDFNGFLQKQEFKYPVVVENSLLDDGQFYGAILEPVPGTGRGGKREEGKNRLFSATNFKYLVQELASPDSRK